MNEFRLDTTVAIVIFNRPDTTARVLAEIARAKPPRLLVIADGPRADRPDEQAKCQATRAIIERVDWDCDVLTNYSEVNLGCKRRVSSGLDWAFQTVEQAIILEDDCLPHPTFFRFCQELLEKYKDDERITMVSGDNFQFGRKRTDYSYYFSHYCHVWGWATWRRAWQYYDVDMKLWPSIRDGNWIRDVLKDDRAAIRWAKTFEVMHQGLVDTWDVQWVFASWIQNGLAILPNTNLISNIGFSPNATHTTSSTSSLANLPTEAIEFPLLHPPFMVRDSLADDITERSLFNATFSSLLQRVLVKVQRTASQWNPLRRRKSSPSED